MRILALLFGVAMLAGADDPKPDDKVGSDLLGTWEGKTAVRSDKEGEFDKTWEIKEGKIVSTPRPSEFKYSHDPKKSPKEIDLIPGAGPSAGKMLKGIYKVEKDKLTICYVRPGVDGAEKRDRPTEFDGKKRDDVVLLTFERKKP